MKRKKILSIILGGLILSQSFSVLAQENISYSTRANVKNETTNEFSVGGIDDFAEGLVIVMEEKFDIGSNGASYSIKFTADSGKGYATINFKERAEDFEIILRDSNGNINHSESFFLAGPGGQGVLSMKLELNVAKGQRFTLEIKNNDSVFISGNIKLEV